MGLVQSKHLCSKGTLYSVDDHSDISKLQAYQVAVIIFNTAISRNVNIFIFHAFCQLENIVFAMTALKIAEILPLSLLLCSIHCSFCLPFCYKIFLLITTILPLLNSLLFSLMTSLTESFHHQVSRLICIPPLVEPHTLSQALSRLFLISFQ